MTAAPAVRQAGSAATLLLSASDIRRLVTMKDVVEVVAQAVRESAAGGLVAPPRLALPGGATLLMAAESRDRGGVGAKLVSVMPGNRPAGLSTIQGLAAWLDHSTRRPLLVADAPAVTALRTGALSGVATAALAPAEASVLAMVGTGGQALALVEACAEARPIRHVRLASAHRSSAEEFRGTLAAFRPDLKVSICDSVAGAVREADVVCLATTATAALVTEQDLPPAVHVNAVGAYRPDMRELGASVFAAATLVCSDDPAGAAREAGDLIDAISCGALDPDSIVELGALDERASRGQCGGITVFKSVGTAAADLALLGLLQERAAADAAVPGFEFSA